MHSSSINRVSYALLISCLLALLATPQSASALSYTGPQFRHVQHANVAAAQEKKRMVKVRQPRALLGNGNANNNNPAAAANGASSSATQASTTQSSSAAAAESTTTAATTSTSQQQQNTIESIVNSINSQSTIQTTTITQPSTTVVSSSAVTSTTAQTTSATEAATSSAPQSIDLNINTQPSSTPTAASQGVSTVAFQSTINALPSSSPSAAAATTSNANTFGRNTIIGIVVIASSIGGAAAIWTLIRKWKLGTSKKFDNRLQPIEWSPEINGNAGSGLPGAIREKDSVSVSGVGAGDNLRRTGSTGSHGSFHSNDIDHNGLGRNVTGNANVFADQNPSGYAPEAHDFTAGAAVLGPYDHAAYNYNDPGYVDLHRADSDSRIAAGGADLARGTSVGHAAAYANGAYGGHDAYAPDAYGGYDAYGQHQYPVPAGGAAVADPYAPHTQQYPAARY